jgi:hypothetical protein
MVQLEADVAATKRNKTIAALTSAALGLPGLNATAAIPADKATGTIQYGHYQENQNRIQSSVYHADALLPLSDRLEISFSIDQDIYSGATPSFSTPLSMKNQPKRNISTGVYEPSDIVAMASPVAGRFELSSGMRSFRAFEEAVFSSPPGTSLRDAFIAGYSAVINQPVPSNTKASQTYAHQPLESRQMPIMGLNYYMDDIKLSLSGGVSSEPDFESNFGSSQVSWELNDKLTTLSAGYGVTSNSISRGTGHNDGAHAFHDGGGDYPELDESSLFHSFNLGIAQVMGKNTLFQINSSYTHQKGYLTNPYKLVYVRGEITAEEYFGFADETVSFREASNLEIMGVDLFREVRPDQRNQWAFSTRLNQYIPSFDAALHADYRYFLDDWGINSHTFELSWHQPMPQGILLTPNFRYYSQSRADFFAPYFLAPRADGYYSSDFRLSGFGAISAGLQLSKEFYKGKVKFNTGFEYTSQQGSLQISSNGEDGYADLNFFLASASINVDLSVLDQLGLDQSGHEHHSMGHQHSAPMPAGVFCFGHMLHQAEDFMIGYMYMYEDRAGGIRRGTQSASDTAILNSACSPGKCTTKTNEMTMHMHMLDIMYAPTDWFNVMLMPQLVNMSMVVNPLPGSTGDSGHGDGSHISDGLGDTLVMGLFKLFDDGTHHFNLGIGISAPTGDVDVTMDGSETSDSIAQDYGMQLGSGTWDLIPTLTYVGHVDKWSWGAQISGNKRLESANRSGYALGDTLQGSAWGGYSIFNWLSASIRGIYAVEGSVKGQQKRLNSQSDPVDFTKNYGGKFWDIGLGLNAFIPNGDYSGHTLSVEWLQPVADDYNGFQLERAGALTATWSYMF